MSYCNIGDNPTLYYSFGNSAQNKIQFGVAPIDISVSTNSNIPNYNPNGYRISFSSIGSFGGGATLTVIGYNTAVNNLGGYSPYIINVWFCPGTSPSQNTYFLDNLNIGIDPSHGCPVPSSSGNTDKISVSYQNNIIWTTSGQHPATYNIVCGDDCPEGYIKCHSNNYPGYCCIPCTDIASRIDNLTQRVRSLKNG